jgi:hypothetical protein
MISVFQCESGLNHYGVYGADGEFGIAQFMRATFYKYAQQGMSWYDLDDQLETAGWMFKNGLAGEWTCYAKFYLN